MNAKMLKIHLKILFNEIIIKSLNYLKTYNALTYYLMDYLYIYNIQFTVNKTFFSY